MIMKRQLAENLSRAEIQDLGLKWSISSLLTGFHFVQRKTLPLSVSSQLKTPRENGLGKIASPLSSLPSMPATDHSLCIGTKVSTSF